MPFKSGPENPRWNRGDIFHGKGYRWIRVGKEHPLADNRGYALEHHVVWVAAGNPLLLPNQILHHVNEIKTDNRIENLIAKDRKEHTEEHNAEAAKAIARMPGYRRPERDPSDDIPFPMPERGIGSGELSDRMSRSDELVNR